ncbi:MAG: M48 family metallopeptidase [Rhodospirillaceae bacterium]|nr:M48 family metallopeptidase [Rhodospirillaceae bacterium]
MGDSGAALLKDADWGARVQTRISAKAKRISLRVDVAEGCIVLVRPKRASDTLVAAFLHDQRRWIEKHAAMLPEKAAITDGSEIAVLGETLTVRAAPSARRGVWKEGGVIHVSGAPEHMARRLRDFLKSQARNAFAAWARGFAEALNVKVMHVGVRDTVTRWGSCTRDGRISLSWRLVLAPADVARYVVAHEVAHLKHMNHAPAFWRTVETLVEDTPAQRQWLRRHGASLHGMF